MCEQYDANQWGWDGAAKRSELAHDARFVLVRGGDGSGSIQAFAHFRFDVNDEVHTSRAVVYVWELQVAEPFQGAGLGRRGPAAARRRAVPAQLRHADRVQVGLSGLAFYMDKLGYAVDDEDPLRSTIPTSATTFCRGGAAASTPRRLRRGERAQGDDPAASCICAALSRRHPKHPT